MPSPRVDANAPHVPLDASAPQVPFDASAPPVPTSVGGSAGRLIDSADGALDAPKSRRDAGSRDASPDAPSADADAGPSAFCGDGKVDPGETCDGNCPTTCDDADPCTSDVLVGDSATCDASCEHVGQDVCQHGDDCCPAGCYQLADADCPLAICLSATCGNGSVEPGESCDGDCPVDCDDGDPCTRDFSSGSAASCTKVCHHSPPSTPWWQPDGCCQNTKDVDCWECGNGRVDPTEVCDGDCPVTAEDCDDGDPCTRDGVVGSPSECRSHCVHTTPDPVCGDGVTCFGESCDGDCPTTAAECDDGNPCTDDSLVADPTPCGPHCRHVWSCGSCTTNACADGDGCCPSGCSSNDDDDCSATCGNGIVEWNETCDGDCALTQADCNDGNACSDDLLFGSAETCDVYCGSRSAERCLDLDGCCSAACSCFNDADCSGMCGNGLTCFGESCDGDCPTASDCDDGDACTYDFVEGSELNCQARCDHFAITECIDGDGCCPPCCGSADSDCPTNCGNGKVDRPAETCDGNCPSTCPEGGSCMLGVRRGAAHTCDVECDLVPVSSCVDGDGCCPSICDAATDDDCP